MKNLVFCILAMLLVMQNSCITDKNKYKESDIYEEYETENGFTVLHIPPVLFKVFLSASNDTKNDSVQILDKIDVVKLLFFEANNHTITVSDLKASMNEKITKFKYNLLTKIADKENDISIYVINNEGLIHEVLVAVVSEKEYVSLNIVGEFSKDEVISVYKSLNMQEMKNYGR